MTVKLRFVAPFAVAFALAPVGIGTAQAQSSSDVDTARAAFLQGLDLRDKQHDNVGAVARFKAAYALVPTPRIGFELGRTMRATGDLVGARAAFLSAAQLPARPNESPEAKKARLDAQAQADDLDPRIPQIQLHLTGIGQIFVDGEAVRHDALAVPRRVNPGSHVVQVQVEGDVKGEQTVMLAEGEHKDVTMSPGAQARVTVTAQATLPQVQYVQPEPQQPYDPFSTPVTNRVKSNAGTKAGLYYAALTLGGVGIIPGLVALGYMKGAQDACANGICTQDADAKKTLAYGFAIGTDVIWGAAIICFVTAIIYPSTSALDLHTTQVGFSPMNGGGMFSATGRF
ncbi:MAG TPA: hypothetical protein VGH87_08260 [Polyangiaceae bacterium]|jgi:hypothetical protein